MQKDQRQQLLKQWLEQQIRTEIQLIPLVADASFRRYFRFHWQNVSYIAVDSPPDKEDSKPFIAVSRAFQAKGLIVPEIIAADTDQGLMWITDLGDQLYFRALNNDNVEHLYGTAIQSLHIIQSCGQGQHWHYPAFDHLMVAELKRFHEWYITNHLELKLTHKEETLLANTFEQLVKTALKQPQLCVHRDYHSRNLMVLNNNRVGILDFQDAVWGPLTYDLVSLLRDCYVAWPREVVEKLALSYFHQIKHKNNSVSDEQFILWFDWMGMQRHLKAMFIFARKFRRDHNPLYLGDIPRTLNYVIEASANYAEFKTFREFLIERVLPYDRL